MSRLSFYTSPANDLKWIPRSKRVVVPVIPEDIIYEILDHLVTKPNPRYTLLSCSLISKSWIIPSRRHLFHTIFFNSSYILKWVQVFPIPEQSPAHLVRDLRISIGSYRHPSIETLGLVGCFTNVMKFSISGEGENQPWCLSSFAGFPRSVTSLVVDANLVTIFQIREVILQLPGLDDLAVLGSLRQVATSALRGVGVGLKGRFGGRLKVYKPEKYYNADVMDMLLEVPTGLRFTEVDIHSFCECFSSTLKLAEACRETLTKFSYIVDNYGGNEALDRSSAFKFAKFPNLKEVRLTVHWTAGALLWISAALSTLKPVGSPYLTVVRLEVTNRGRPRDTAGSVEQMKNEFKLIEGEVDRVRREFGRSIKVTLDSYGMGS